MSQLKNILFALFISPEAIVMLLIAMCFTYYPEVLNTLGYKLKSDSEVWKYLPTLTLFFSGIAFSLSSKLRAPLENSSNKLLYEWPQYPMLVARVMVGLGFSTVCGMLGLALWIFGQSLSDEIVGGLFLVGTCVSATTALTMLLAHQKLKELIDR